MSPRQPQTPTGRRLFTDNEPGDMLESDGVTWDDVCDIEAEAIAARDAELRAAVEPLCEAARDVRLSHRPNEWDSCVACRHEWPCDAELLAELVMTHAALLDQPVVPMSPEP